MAVMNKLFEKINRFLHTPLFGTKYIHVPPDARVDPAGFSEEEYPVVCPKCTYLLRGLADGRCPECGTPFDRGQLLVRQYVTRRWQYGGGKRFGAIVNYIAISWFLFVAGAFAWAYFWFKYRGLGSITPQSTTQQFMTAVNQSHPEFVVKAAFASPIVAVLLILFFWWRYRRECKPLGEKCKRVKRVLYARLEKTMP